MACLELISEYSSYYQKAVELQAIPVLQYPRFHIDTRDFGISEFCGMYSRLLGNNSQ